MSVFRWVWPVQVPRMDARRVAFFAVGISEMDVCILGRLLWIDYELIDYECDVYEEEERRESLWFFVSFDAYSYNTSTGMVPYRTIPYNTALYVPLLVSDSGTYSIIMYDGGLLFFVWFYSTVGSTRIIQNNDQFGIEHVLPQSVSSTHISTIHHKKILDQVPRMWTTPTIIFMSLFLQKQHLSLIVYSYVPINTVITTD